MRVYSRGLEGTKASSSSSQIWRSSLSTSRFGRIEVASCRPQEFLATRPAAPVFSKARRSSFIFSEFISGQGRASLGVLEFTSPARLAGQLF